MERFKGMIWMRAGVLLFALFTLVGPRSALALDGWISSWSSAKATAKRTEKPIVAVFVRDGCAACEQLDELLKTRHIRGVLGNCVRVRLEYTDYSDLAASLGVTVTPTTLLLTPDTGFAADLYREEGALSVAQLRSLGGTVDRLYARSAVAKKEPQGKPEKNPTAKQKEKSVAAEVTSADKGGESEPAGLAQSGASSISPTAGSTYYAW
jgi:hypothetical protein